MSKNGIWIEVAFLALSVSSLIAKLRIEVSVMKVNIWEGSVGRKQ